MVCDCSVHKKNKNKNARCSAPNIVFSSRHRSSRSFIQRSTYLCWCIISLGMHLTKTLFSLKQWSDLLQNPRPTFTPPPPQKKRTVIYFLQFLHTSCSCNVQITFVHKMYLQCTFPQNCEAKKIIRPWTESKQFP